MVPIPKDTPRWLRNVRVGEEVARCDIQDGRSIWSIRTVDRAEKINGIMVHEVGGIRFVDGLWCSQFTLSRKAFLSPVTPEIVEEVEVSPIRKVLAGVVWDSVPAEKVLRIIGILGEGRAPE